ncbi:MAG: glucose 6-phosphate dehydrogenase [Prochlorococcus sp. SP3034]|nr:glucose 6-phosphate dehydrogenase [Prochlorococcus sp. SP3034]|tara:strand:+ start:3700 stop:4998 length:1299 start_codon:yes stop_codon:yes gene_type:complete
MKPQLTLQTPLELPPEEISNYLEKLWISENEYSLGANTFSLIVWQPSWLEQCLVRSNLIRGPITGNLSQDIIKTAKDLILENRLPLATSLYSNKLIDLLKNNISNDSEEDLRGQFFESSITTLNPRRLITLAPTFSRESEIKTYVSAYCPLSDDYSSQTICGDLVVIRGGTQSIYSKGLDLVNNLSIDELPSWLWWNSSLDDSPEIFDFFRRNGSRLIIDTANGSIKRCIDVLNNALNSKIAINDLNWVRLKSWRESLAMIFDPPSRRDILEHISDIDIDIEGEHIIQALFLISWISDRLDWKFIRIKKTNELTQAFFVRTNGEEIKVSINPLPLGNPSIHSGQVIGLRLISKISKNPKQNTCIILGSESVECMRLEAGGMADMHLIEEVVPYSLSPSETDVSQLLRSSRGNTSPLFENAIKVSKRIYEAIN